MDSLLTPEDFATLHNILLHKTLLKTADFETIRSLLEPCGLSDVCSTFSPSTPVINVIIQLCPKLSKIYITHGIVRRVGLAIFLDYLCQIDPYLTHEDVECIQCIITKCEPKTRSESLLSRYHHERSISPSMLPGSQRAKIDKNAIIRFDLEFITRTFEETIKYEGTFAFSIGGDAWILKSYIIERLLWQLKNKMYRQCERPIHLFLYNADLTQGAQQIIERKLEEQGYTQLGDMFYDPGDIMLIIWNRDIPQDHMQTIARSFWENVKIQISPFVQNKSRCFVTIWANINQQPLEDFTLLSLPERFEVCELKQWFQAQLRKHGLDETIIFKCCLKKFNNRVTYDTRRGYEIIFRKEPLSIPPYISRPHQIA